MTEKKVTVCIDLEERAKDCIFAVYNTDDEDAVWEDILNSEEEYHESRKDAEECMEDRIMLSTFTLRELG